MFVLIMFEIKKRVWENNKKLKSLFSFYAPNSNVCVLNYSVSFIDLQIFFLLFFGCLLKLVLWIKCNVLLSVLCITKEEK